MSVRFFVAEMEKDACGDAYQLYGSFDYRYIELKCLFNNF